MKNLIDNYVEDDERINSFLMPRMPHFVQYFVNSKGGVGIRMSIYLSIFKPKKLKHFVEALVKLD